LQYFPCSSGVHDNSDADTLETDLCIRILTQNLDTALESVAYNKIGMDVRIRKARDGNAHQISGSVFGEQQQAVLLTLSYQISVSVCQQLVRSLKLK